MISAGSPDSRELGVSPGCLASPGQWPQPQRGAGAGCARRCGSGRAKEAQELWHRKGSEPCFTRRGSRSLPGVCVADRAGLLKAGAHPAWPSSFSFPFIFSLSARVLFLSAFPMRHLRWMRRQQHWPTLALLVKLCHSPFYPKLCFKAWFRLHSTSWSLKRSSYLSVGGRSAFP